MNFIADEQLYDKSELVFTSFTPYILFKYFILYRIMTLKLKIKCESSFPLDIFLLFRFLSCISINSVKTKNIGTKRERDTFYLINETWNGNTDICSTYLTLKGVYCSFPKTTYTTKFLFTYHRAYNYILYNYIAIWYNYIIKGYYTISKCPHTGTCLKDHDSP